jgi:two-component system chemotaxis sensor kinase CheA
MGEQEEILKEFLVECSEGLARLDQEFVTLEKEPTNMKLVGSIFRTIHTIKGTCGFMGLPKLENVAHGSENILSMMRDGKLSVTPKGITTLLEAVDAIKEILAHIESNGKEPKKNYTAVREKLDAILAGQAASQAKAAPVKAEPVKIELGPAPTPFETSPEVKEAAEFRPEGDPGSGTAPSAETRAPSAAESSIRVDVGLLDKLMNLVSELVLARNQLLQHVKDFDDSADTGTVQRMNLITTDLQDTVMKTRMQPIRNVWDKFPRVVRDLALSNGKEVELLMEGAETDLDKTLLEAIKDPLTHIVRNAVDHGIETPEARKKAGKHAKGTLYLKAFHEGGQINIEITDDGLGIDLEKVKRKAVEKGLISAEAVLRLSDREAIDLVFLPGLSTAEKVTNVSGRGVGMDVVKTNIEKIGGTMELTSNLGKGTNLRIKIPLTLAIIPALMATVDGELFAIPRASLLELVHVDQDSVDKTEAIHGSEFYRLRGELLPLISLKKILRLEKQVLDDKTPSKGKSQGSNIIVLKTLGRSFGLIVDGVNDSEEIVVKPLGRQLKGLSVFAGATIMGDGRVALILDVSGLAKEGGLFHAAPDEQEMKNQEEIEEMSAGESQTFLIFSISGHDRFAVPLALVTRLEQFSPDQIEQTAEGEVIQYRESLLQLIRLDKTLGIAGQVKNQESLPVIVFSEGTRSIGMVVGHILDIIEQRVEIHHSISDKLGVSGSVVVQGRTTDILDIYQAIEKGMPGWLKGRGLQRSSEKQRILVVDDSAFFRAMIKPYLEMEGYKVLEASDGEEALKMLSKNQVDLVLSDIEMPNMDGIELAKQMISLPQYADLPMIALTSLDSEGNRLQGEQAGFKEYLIKFDRGALLSAIRRILSQHENINRQLVAGQ